ncbi:STAS/SEC14 domain-containing protein [Horticoccus luteus]|uniref:STAS/SEC14 domain-containing protein n=1 Tax=Horticoccus luteus TaxID=2862869 RepID=A0A8F9TWE8_9BACT|nr:STAS/SEC14 domain-containing protein [Horticoccus luteus]QYM79543.1 STAS/SEC14 domain-containing protein [Horticoccus luteus]
MNTTTHSDHVRIETVPATHTLEIRAHGKLTRADYDRLLPEIETLTASWPKINFFIVLDDFDGWEPAAAWADLKYDVRNGNRFGRAAIIGDSASERWGTRFTNLVLPGEIKFFEPAETSAARAWVHAAG